jgi:hypothetical protein
MRKMLPNDFKSLNEVDVKKMTDHEIHRIAFDNMWEASYSHLDKYTKDGWNQYKTIMNQAHWQGYRFAMLLLKKTITTEQTKCDPS